MRKTRDPDGIRTSFLGSRLCPELSDPARGLFTFAYSLALQDLRGKGLSQVVGREWVITHLKGHFEFTHGDAGVVGRKPVLPAGGAPFKCVSPRVLDPLSAPNADPGRGPELPTKTTRYRRLHGVNTESRSAINSNRRKLRVINAAAQTWRGSSLDAD